MTQCFKIIWQTGIKKSLGIIVQVYLNLTTPSIQSHVIYKNRWSLMGMHCFKTNTNM